MNDDLISRQAVNEIINDIRDCISVEGYCAILERLKKLPPVNPQEPIRCKDCIHNNNCDIQYHAQAGDMFYCGMVEPQESEDKCKNCKYYHNPDYTRCHKCKAESEGKE